MYIDGNELRTSLCSELLFAVEIIIGVSKHASSSLFSYKFSTTPSEQEAKCTWTSEIFKWYPFGVTNMVAIALSNDLHSFIMFSNAP